MSKAPEAALPYRPSRRLHRRLMLGANIILAAGALVWAARVSSDIGDPAVPLVASRLARGEKYDPALLRGMIASNLPAAERQCNSKTLRELLLLQIGLADETVRSANLQQADTDTAGVNSQSKALLACAPTESLGWLGTYWSSIRQEGFGPRAVTLLDQSYRQAPHEAWLQLIRAPLALRSFNALPPALQDAVAQDFEDIFQARLYPSAAILYQGATATAQVKLLDRTCAAAETERLVFLHFVSESGLQIRHRCYPAGPAPAVDVRRP
ncbi:hypothetical protein JQ629_30360 [Bradyrhizobium sp. AUGA SZCCT0222]|uniref:hypothetical protein n=1 Tax=Bradyrhizobium sp. AUGA SZCCT0222 TaxID=2807668 RepID=UPI001BA50EE3|nr:hypothetical protein [Bradyrhizobium sp. AUGA SZCCT0222]MBR1271796.1 hypothetical protein [Bradyrhizobium sp. AUGA SZCCT0222]